MIKFESDNIIVGYIKNYLHEFNLPLPKIYTPETVPVEGLVYLKGNKIVRYKNGKFLNLSLYTYNEKIINYTSNLKFTGITYDAHTHEYLGEYLRFLRDYKNLNLMSLYNCFSNTYAKNLNLHLNLDSEEGDEWSANSMDKNYKLICLPVKLDQEYTIAIDSNLPFEVFCGLYDSFWVDSEKNKKLAEKTYQKIGNNSFSCPKIYSKLKELKIKEEGSEEISAEYTYASKQEKVLKLFIKLPASIESSIVILEGRYYSGEFSFSPLIQQNKETEQKIDPFRIKYAQSILNFEEMENEKPNYKAYSTNDTLRNRHQLLELNTGISYPFADRLVEYLLENAITNTETIPDNIKRLQWSLYTAYSNNWNQNTHEVEINYGLPNISNYGLWDDKFKLVLYNLAKSKNLTNTKTDILGYVDKDIEQALGKTIDIYLKED